MKCIIIIIIIIHVTNKSHDDITFDCDTSYARGRSFQVVGLSVCEILTKCSRRRQ